MFFFRPSYRQQTKFGQRNFFICACHFVHGRGRGEFTSGGLPFGGWALSLGGDLLPKKVCLGGGGLHAGGVSYWPEIRWDYLLNLNILVSGGGSAPEGLHPGGCILVLSKSTLHLYCM